MINYRYKDLFDKDSIDKQFMIIAVDSPDIIDNTILYENSFELEESIFSSGGAIRFGGCEATSVKFRIRNAIPSLIGKKIMIGCFLNGDMYEPFVFGTFIVDSDTYTDGRLYRDVTAYSEMKRLNDMDITGWYNSLTFPMTIKQLRDSFFDTTGIEQERVVLPFDNLSVNKKEMDSLNGHDFLYDLCELNARFGYIDRENVFRYIKISQENDVVKSYKANEYISTKYEDYFSEPIIKVSVYQGNNKGNYTLDNGNEYVISDNLFLYGKDDAELNAFCEAFFNEVRYLKYKIMPQLATRGNPCYEVGDKIGVQDKSVWYDTFILNRKIVGIQGMRDSIEAKGTMYQNNVSRQSSTASKATTSKVQSLKIRWVNSVEEVGSDPYTFYCIPKKKSGDN